MADFVKDIPNGTMMIRDTGGWVEFWFKTSASTWNYQQNWGYFANGIFHEGVSRLEKNGLWHKFGAEFITESQEVMFRMIDEGLGWPTSELRANIVRGRIPDPPDAPRVISRDPTGIRVAFDANYDGGRPILEHRIWMSYDTKPRFWIDNSRDSYISPLSPKTPYYFWGQVRNELGWSNIGPRLNTQTSGVPDAPQPPMILPVGLNTAVGFFRSPLPWDGGSKILEWQFGYGTEPNTPQTLVSGFTLTRHDFLPGRQYYFWVRARNAIGWSNWSGRTSILFAAGAFVKQNGVWKRALPWIKVNGVWKVAEPRTKSGTSWRLPRA